MLQTTGVAVLATHLAATDRRALSQAWYSALHLAGDAARPAGERPASVTLAGARTAARASRAETQASRFSAAERGARSLARVPAPRREPSAAEAERRTPKPALARRLERALVRRVPPAGTTSFAVRAAGGRIHLVVRGEGARTHVVAVCAPALRERVERALAHARFALAGCGLRAEVA